jgi:hypothetical protein
MFRGLNSYGKINQQFSLLPTALVHFYLCEMNPVKSGNQEVIWKGAFFHSLQNYPWHYIPFKWFIFNWLSVCLCDWLSLCVCAQIHICEDKCQGSSKGRSDSPALELQAFVSLHLKVLRTKLMLSAILPDHFMLLSAEPSIQLPCWSILFMYIDV